MTFRLWTPDGPEVRPFYDDGMRLYCWYAPELYLWGEAVCDRYYETWVAEGNELGFLTLPQEVDE